MSKPDMSYHRVRINRWTFKNDEVRREVEKRLQGRVLNACCGKARLAHGGEIVRNDIMENRNADTHYNVKGIAEHFESGSFDTVVYDPLWSVSQLEKYGLERSEAAVAGDKKPPRQFDQLLSDGGRIIQFGYTTTCMPDSVGDYSREWVGVFNTLGSMNDFLGVMDVKEGQSNHDTQWW